MGFDLRLLIHSKCFDSKTTQDLLEIANSSTWVEDLIDYIGEYEIPENCQVCEEVTFKEGAIKRISELLKKLGYVIDDDDDEDDILHYFDSAINEVVCLTKEKPIPIRKGKAIIGGIECPCG